MPSLETIEKFIYPIEREPHDKVIEQFYTDNASIQENQNNPKAGKEALIDFERRILAKALIVHSKCIRPFVQHKNNVVIRWRFRFEWKDHTVTDIEEMAYQEREENKIEREQFYYHPKQLEPKK